MAPAVKDAWLMSTVCWKLAKSFSAKSSSDCASTAEINCDATLNVSVRSLSSTCAEVTAVWSLAACRRCWRFFPRSNR